MDRILGAEEYLAIETGETHVVVCKSHKPVKWLFQAYQDESKTFHIVSWNHHLLLKQTDFDYSGLYYCHGDISGGKKFLSNFTLNVYGNKI